MDEIVKHFGGPFIEHCLNLAPNEFSPTIKLSDKQQEVLSAMQHIVLEAQAHQDPFITHLHVSQRVGYSSQLGASLANLWRTHCGGDLAQSRSDDAVENALLALAVEAYPQFLLPPAPRPNVHAPSPLFYGHPQSQEIAKQILLDPTLSRLFPEAPEASTYEGDGMEIQSTAVWSNGTSGTMQLGMLPAALLRSGAIKLAETSTIDDYFDGVRRALRHVRSLASKKATKVPALIGLASLELVGVDRLEFKGGLLRLPTVRDIELLMGAENVVAVLEVEVNLQLLSVSPFNPIQADDDSFMRRFEQNRPRFEKFSREFRRTIDLACLTMLLASAPGQYIAPVEMATAVHNPATLGMSAGMSPYKYPVSTFGTTPVDRESAASIEFWASKVAEHPLSLDMTMRRLLSAVSRRLDPLDSFIDAVICWENMFGTGEGEVSFRVSGAIAHLMEPSDPAARKKLFDEVKAMYGTRSKLVHGAKEPSPRDSVDQMMRAVDISIQCLRLLYEKPHLLAVGSSGERGRMLLLGA
ncbi:HEPN domain-containing protein [Streptomyces sp. Ru71]|uniref:HEPN domain-containing protein n=1 Tax=Streptomyces sp. Ru71 TaxID=2080746 RepID=UPI0011B00D6A|nr:HEPN domain-containing protein [Streptomyces sp. Ru71]